MADSGDELDAADLAALRRAMEGLQGSGWRAPEQPAGTFTPRFADLEAWVNGFFVLTFGRGGGQHWCAVWWDHPEAMFRLDLLWRTWEIAALDPLHGVANWTRDHLDPNLNVLFSATGPFAACTSDHHSRSPVLPVTPPPDGWWDRSQHWWEVLGEADR
jgi:hypothetical protein